VYSKSREGFFFFEDFQIWLFSHWDFLHILRFWMFFNAMGFFNRKKNRQNLAFFCAEKLHSENAYEPHTDIHYQSLLF